MWADDTVSQVSCISSAWKQFVKEVCVIEPPAVVSDEGYELNGDTGLRENDITVESKVSGMENEN